MAVDPQGANQFFVIVMVVVVVVVVVVIVIVNTIDELLYFENLNFRCLFVNVLNVKISLNNLLKNSQNLSMSLK